MNLIPDDVIRVIVIALVEPLRDKEKLACSTGKYPNVPTDTEKTLYSYFNLLVTSKQFNRATGQLDFDWLLFVRHSSPGWPLGQIAKYQKEQEELLDPVEKERLARNDLPYLANEPKKMLRTLTMCDYSLPVIRAEIDTFMAKNRLTYRTKATGKVYKGYIGIRKLKTMKIQPKHRSDEFKAMLKRYESLHEKSISLGKALRAYAVNKCRPQHK